MTLRTVDATRLIDDMHKYFKYIKSEVSVIKENNGTLYMADNPKAFIMTLQYLIITKSASLENIKDLIAQYVKQETDTDEQQG